MNLRFAQAMSRENRPVVDVDPRLIAYSECTAFYTSHHNREIRVEGIVISGKAGLATHRAVVLILAGPSSLRISSSCSIPVCGFPLRTLFLPAFR